MDKQRVNGNIQNLFEVKSSNQALCGAFKDALFSANNRGNRRIAFIISIVFSVLISFNSETVLYVKEIIEFFNGVAIDVFAIIFTGYALFQAIMGKKMLRNLMMKNENGDTYLKISNDYFLNIMMLYFVEIIINIILTIVLKTVASDFTVFTCMILNNVACSILLFLYFYYCMYTLLETKNFIFNVYQILNIYAASEIKEDEEQQNKK